MPGESSPDPENDPPRLPSLRDLLIHGVGIRSIALTVLMLLAVLYTLHFAKAVILPIVLAVLLSMLLAPLVRLMNRRLHIPMGLGAGLVLAALLGTLVLSASFVIEPATAWIRTVPERIPELKYRLTTLQKPLEKVREATQQVEEITNPSTERTVKVQEKTLLSVAMAQTPAFLANLGVMFILLYFMLASGDVFLRKLVRMIPSFQDKRRAVEIAREIEDRIARYLRAVTVINLGLGTAVGAAAYFIGLQNYLLWGVLAFVLNYIPYVGALVGVAATLLVSLFTFESLSYALLMPAVYLGLNAIEGNLLTPMVVGRILTLNTVMVFISLMFWGWIWGVVGALLAVPILAMIKIICDHITPLAPIGEFIGGDTAEEGQSPA
jgi:predicted PurR-regulated permease PerM